MTVDKELAELRQKYYGLFVHLFGKSQIRNFCFPCWKELQNGLKELQGCLR